MPESELSDPLPSKNRGYYFAAGKLVQLPPHPRSLTSAPLSFNVEFTMEVWVRKLASGVIQPIYWKSGSLPIVTFYIDSNEKLGFNGGWPPTSLQSSGTVGYDQWTRLILIAKFSNTLGETTLTFIINSGSSTALGEFYIQDLDQSYPQTIGSTFDQTKSFTGFIWSLKVWNYALDPTTTAAAYTPNTPASGILLSTCGTAAEPDLCGACPVACTNGCVRTSDCGLCANRRCVLCDNFNTLECFSCIEHADIGPYKFCDCRPGRFFNEITVTCDLCDSQCMKCADAQPAKCLKCYPGAELISGSGSGCVCGESYYPNPTPSSCSPCPSSCLACTSPLVCTGCWSKASLQGSSCVCNAQHYPAPDASNCLQCASNCQRCDSSGCLQCISERYLESGICVLICDSSYTPDPAAMVCTYNPSSQTPPYASMHISSNTLITISFTKELAARLVHADFGMILTDMEGFEYSVGWSVGAAVNGSTYPVSIAVNATYLPSENDFTVYFPNQAKMVDSAGLTLATTELTGELPGIGSLSESTQSSSSTFSTSKAMASGTLASSLVLSLISGNPGTMWSLMNGMALLSYSTCMNLNTSQAQTDFFGSLNVQSFVPNPFKYILPEPEEGDAPGYGGFETSLFLHNAGVMFTVGVSLLIYWPFVALMAHFPIRLIALYYSHLLEAFRWNILLRYWTQIYLDVAIASFLQLSNISFSTLATSLNSLLGLGFAVAFGLTPALIVWLVLNLTSETSGKFVFPSRFSMIFRGFVQEKGRSRMLFYPIFFFERLVIAGALIFLRTWPIAQVSFCLFSTIIVITTQMIVYQFIYKPYVDVIDGLCSFTTEACTVLVYLILAVYLWPLDSSSQSFYEVLLMAVVLITVGIMTLLSAYKLIVSLKRLLTEYRKELKKSVRPIVRAMRTFKTANQTSIHIEAQAKPSAFHLGH